MCMVNHSCRARIASVLMCREACDATGLVFLDVNEKQTHDGNQGNGLPEMEVIEGDAFSG